MQKLSIQKMSLLGVVLVAASAVTAAVLPSNKKSNTPKMQQAGSLTASARNPQQLTCKPTGVITAPCNDTITDGVNSFTTSQHGASASSGTGTPGTTVE